MKHRFFNGHYWYFFLLLAAVTGTLLWIFPSRKPVPLPDGTMESRPHSVATPLSRNPPPSTQETVQERVQERGRVPEISRSLPDLHTYREEAKANPHSTPPSILRLAEVLAENRLEVKAHPEKASSMMKELQDCVVRTGELPAAQAMCLTNGEQLVKEGTQKERPGLQIELEKLRNMASPEAQKIVQQIGQI